MLPETIDLSDFQAEVEIKPPFPLISASQLTTKPVSIDWLLHNILERGSLNLLFGEPGAGKSLFALDWAFCIAAGIDYWYGNKTKQVDVVVIAGEGFAGIARRLNSTLSYFIPAPLESVWRGIPWPFASDHVAY